LFKKASDATSSKFGCIKKENQVVDCLKYGEDGTCYCEGVDDSKWEPIIIKNGAADAWGCVPISLQKVNGVCTYKSPKQYDCVCLSSSKFNFNIKMDT
jgi:hypothetical protein